MEFRKAPTGDPEYMNVRIELTIRVKDSDNLRIVAGEAETRGDVRNFLKMDVSNYIETYLSDNGVEVEVYEP